MFVADSLVVIGLATLSLGTIQEADGVVERSFWVRNAGTEAVTLMQGYTSCGCTTIQFAKDSALAPGDSTSVLLRFNPRGKGGEFYEQGTLVYGPHRKRLQMALEGTCMSSEETLMRQFPIRVSDRIRLSADRFDLGVMRVGETKERGVVVLDMTDSQHRQRIPVTLTVTQEMPKGVQHIPRRLKWGGEEFTVTLDVNIR
ncbi:MAG: DUF1573 domain-containing protein [Prevotella sp.]|nr:DUF1573 domain-containing protein [Prevotella sp.]